MGRVNVAAQIVMKDKRENAEKRKQRAKTSGDVFVNQNEIKVYSKTARKRRGPGPYGEKPGLSNADDLVQDKGKDDFTYTYGQYDQLLKHQEYCLTMQDKYIKEDELEDEDQETADESKSQ